MTKRGSDEHANRCNVIIRLVIPRWHNITFVFFWMKQMENQHSSDTLAYLSGFGNHLSSEAIAGALPESQNSPLICPFGLYAEQISGTSFTAPRKLNQRRYIYLSFYLSIFVYKDLSYLYVDSTNSVAVGCIGSSRRWLTNRLNLGSLVTGNSWVSSITRIVVRLLLNWGGGRLSFRSFRLILLMVYLRFAVLEAPIFDTAMLFICQALHIFLLYF